MNSRREKLCIGKLGTREDDTDIHIYIYIPHTGMRDNTMFSITNQLL